MNHTYYFMAGLPRAGGTLLKSIIDQNPEIYAGPVSPVIELMYYNQYYPGNQIAMSQPLYEDLVEYADGTEATVEQLAEDISSFMMWAAEPKLEQRKKMGFKVTVFLLVLLGLLYYSKKKIWARIDH